MRHRLGFCLLVGAATLALGGAVHLSWLLWRFVPPHAALFEGLGSSLSREATIAITASNWFVRALPLVVLLTVGIGGLVLVPLTAYGLHVGNRWPIGAVASVLALVGIAELGGSALVLRAMEAACWRASADPRFVEELGDIRRAGESVCPSVGSP